MFINVAQLYLSMKITEEPEIMRIAWVLFYVQKGTTEAWKNNLLDELAKGISEVTMVEKLFAKMKNEFGKTSKAKRKME